ncbi:MAG TPA: hypothetical protein DDZ51_31240 [Planctomycetaceae bacterium]|nr:hypothetical protein [Planctomycetaceae bacterium]
MFIVWLFSVAASKSALVMLPAVFRSVLTSVHLIPVSKERERSIERRPPSCARLMGESALR